MAATNRYLVKAKTLAESIRRRFSLEREEEREVECVWCHATFKTQKEAVNHLKDCPQYPEPERPPGWPRLFGSNGFGIESFEEYERLVKEKAKDHANFLHMREEAAKLGRPRFSFWWRA